MAPYESGCRHGPEAPGITHVGQRQFSVVPNTGPAEKIHVVGFLRIGNFQSSGHHRETPVDALGTASAVGCHAAGTADIRATHGLCDQISKAKIFDPVKYIRLCLPEERIADCRLGRQQPREQVTQPGQCLGMGAPRGACADMLCQERQVQTDDTVLAEVHAIPPEAPGDDHSQGCKQERSGTVCPLLQGSAAHPRPDRYMPNPIRACPLSENCGKFPLCPRHRGRGAVADERNALMPVHQGVKSTCEAVEAAREHDDLVGRRGVLFSEVEKGDHGLDRGPVMIPEGEDIPVL